MTDETALPPISDETRAAITALIDAYGGNVSRWPDEAREAYGALASSQAFSEQMRNALALDALLEPGKEIAPPHSLNDRLLADFDSITPDRKISFWSWLNELAPRQFLAPASGFAAIAIAGFFAGFVETSTLSPEEQVYAYLADPNDSYFQTLEEAVQ